MMRRFLLAALSLVAGPAACNDWMDDEGGGHGPAAIETCACARFCGLPVVDGLYWIDVDGRAHQLGLCQQLPDRMTDTCGCPASPSAVSLPRTSPNH